MCQGVVVLFTCDDGQALDASASRRADALTHDAGDVVQRRGAELSSLRPRVPLDLLQARRVGDHAADLRPRPQPGDRQLPDCLTVGVCDLLQARNPAPTARRSTATAAASARCRDNAECHKRVWTMSRRAHVPY